MFRKHERTPVTARGVAWLAVAAALLIAASFALAHAVSLWAYVEDGRVYVEAFFSDGTKVNNGPIHVLSADEQVLLEGKTDKEGKFEFDPPAKQDMIILLRLDGGHHAEFKLKKADFDPPESKEKDKPAEKPENESGDPPDAD